MSEAKGTMRSRDPRRAVRWSAMLAGTLLVSPAGAQSLAPLQGFVADEATLRLIPAAVVTIQDEGLETLTGPGGSFAFPTAPLGPVSVLVTAPGYGTVVEEVEVRAGRVTFLQVLLSRSDGDASLRVRVTDGVSTRPVSGARVGFPDLDLFTVAGANGEASVTGIPPGEHLFEVTMLGYDPAQAVVVFEPGSVAEGEVQPGTEPIELEGIDVTARARWSSALERSGFYGRAESGLGRHLDRLAIEEMNPTLPSDLFRRIPSVRLAPAGLGRYALVSRRGFGGFDSPGSCRMSLYLDGLPFGEDIDELPIDWIEGLEVYIGVSQIPAQFLSSGRNTNCGVVLIWTR